MPERAKTAFIEAVNAARIKLHFDIWAYVLMPEHVHLVICPRRQEYSISGILFAVKRPVSYRLGRPGRAGMAAFWQPGGGYDRNLWKPATIHKEVDYIHLNPVRRGLCERAEQWSHSSAGYYAGMGSVPLLMDNTLPPKEN